MTTPLEDLATRVADLENLVKGRHHPRLDEHSRHLEVHDRQIEQIIYTQDDTTSTVGQMRALCDRLNSIVTHQIGEFHAVAKKIDEVSSKTDSVVSSAQSMAADVKTLLERMPVPPKATP